MVGRGVCFSRVENDACFLENWEPCVFQNRQILNAPASFVSELNSFVAAIFSLEHFLLLSSWQVVIMESNPESETDDFLNESETDDFTLTSRKRPSIQLPVEIRKGLSPELFSTDRKALIRHMWACDESVLFKHQVTLLQLIRENLGKACWPQPRTSSCMCAQASSVQCAWKWVNCSLVAPPSRRKLSSFGPNCGRASCH